MTYGIPPKWKRHMPLFKAGFYFYIFLGVTLDCTKPLTPSCHTLIHLISRSIPKALKKNKKKKKNGSFQAPNLLQPTSKTHLSYSKLLRCRAPVILQNSWNHTSKLGLGVNAPSQVDQATQEPGRYMQKHTLRQEKGASAVKSPSKHCLKE